MPVCEKAHCANLTISICNHAWNFFSTKHYFTRNAVRWRLNDCSSMQSSLVSSYKGVKHLQMQLTKICTFPCLFGGDKTDRSTCTVGHLQSKLSLSERATKFLYYTQYSVQFYFRFGRKSILGTPSHLAFTPNILFLTARQIVKRADRQESIGRRLQNMLILICLTNDGRSGKCLGALRSRRPIASLSNRWANSCSCLLW